MVLGYEFYFFRTIENKIIPNGKKALCWQLNIKCVFSLSYIEEEFLENRGNIFLLFLSDESLHGVEEFK